MFALGGNPVILELIEDGADIDKFLEVDSFPAEFRSTNPKLEAFMTIDKYETLVNYITQIGPPEDKARSYKYPLIAAEILAIDNRNTQAFLLREEPTLVQETITEERWIEKEFDQCDSDYGSECKSSRSRRSVEDFFEEEGEKKGQENIPPPQKVEARASIDSHQKSGSSGSNASITSDDFPLVEDKVRMIKVKKTITRNQEREIPPLLDTICSSFSRELNHTLAGYTCRVLEALLKKHPRRILQQFFRKSHQAHQKYSRLLSSHLESQSVCEFVTNLLLANESEAEDGRKQFLTTMMREIALHPCENRHELFWLKNNAQVLMDIVSKADINEASWARKLLLSIFEEPSLQIIASKCFSDKIQHKFKETFLEMLLSFLKKLDVGSGPKRNSLVVTVVNEEESKAMVKRICELLEPSLKEFLEKTWESVSLMEEEGRKVPSFLVIKYMQIINFLIKHNLFWARTELANQTETARLLAILCKEFPKNSLLHNQIFELLKLLTSIAYECPSLWAKVLDNKHFLLFCLDALGKKDLLYRGQCIYLCQAIKNSKAEVIRNFKLMHEVKWGKVEELLHEDSEKINRTLGGFSKKAHECELMFEKVAILERYRGFLKGELVEKEEQGSEEDVEDLTSSRGSAQWNDWNEFSNYTDEVND